jgi:SAM-dependent methyltransferase
MAVKFPKSRFYAYEISPRSLDVIRKRVKDFDLKNLIVCDVTQRGVGDGPDAPHTDFGFVYAHDVLHDMTTPRALIADVKKRLAPGGCWIIVDVVCGGSTAENLRMSSAPTKLGFSCLLCLSSAMSTADGEGLGTMGFSIGLAQQWMKEAGFAHCVPIKFPSLPDNQGFLVG